jgi:hypothetical protein
MKTGWVWSQYDGKKPSDLWSPEPQVCVEEDQAGDGNWILLAPIPSHHICSAVQTYRERLALCDANFRNGITDHNELDSAQFALRQLIHLLRSEDNNANES